MTEQLVKRLELAVSRLEAFCTQKPNLAPKPNLSGGNNGNSATQTAEAPSTVKQYDEHIEEPLKVFISLCNSIGGDLADMGCKLKLVFDLQKNFIWSAAGQPEPADISVIQSKLEPIVKQLEAISSFKESKRNTDIFNHLSSIAEAVQAVGWLSVKPTPAPFIKEMLDAAMFYVNRVRTANKDKQVHAEWAKALCELFNSLQKYVRQAHTTGLVWNSAPGSVPPSDHQGGKAAVSATAGGPPLPPPPPPPSFFADLSSKGGDTANTDRQKLFAELNKGEAITSGLRKVTADMQTHKNPNLRAGSTVPSGSASSKSPSTSATKPSQPVDKPPKTELKDGKVWNVEYHKNNKNIVLETDMKQAVYIFKCENSLIQVKGKINSITLDGCKKTCVAVDNLLAQIEVINCQSVKVQTFGTMPTISIQKTDGCQVYLSKQSLDAEIITSKSSEMNILAPHGEDNDFVEYPVPEQFKTTLSSEKKRLETVVSDIV